jgi:hypothetical protein
MDIGFLRPQPSHSISANCICSTIASTLTLFLFTFLFSPSLWGNPCDQQWLKKAISGKNGYRERNGICEGLYSQAVSAGFELISLEEVPIAPYEKGDALRILFPKLVNSFMTLPLNISAVAIRAETYYRMDAQFGQAQDILWPVEILMADDVALTNKDIGIFGWFDTPKTRVVFPIKVVIDNNPAISSTTRMVLRSGAPIQRMNWYLIVEDKQIEKHKLRGTFPVGKLIVIDIKWPEPRPDRVKIQVKAKAHLMNKLLEPIFEIAVPQVSSIQSNQK